MGIAHKYTFLWTKVKVPVNKFILMTGVIDGFYTILSLLFIRNRLR